MTTRFADEIEQGEDRRSSRCAERQAARQRRGAHDIRKLAAAVKSHVRAHPGARVSAIADHLGVETRELALPLAKRLRSKELKQAGVKRATRYVPRVTGTPVAFHITAHFAKPIDELANRTMPP